MVHIEQYFDDVDESFVSKFYHILVSIEGILAALSHSRHYELDEYVQSAHWRDVHSTKSIKRRLIDL